GVCESGAKEPTGLEGTGVCDLGGIEPSGLKGAGVCDLGGIESTGLKGAGMCDSGGTEPTGLKGAGMCDSGGIESTRLKGAGMCDSGGIEPTRLKGAGMCDSGGTEPTGLKGAGMCDSGGIESTRLKGAGMCDSGAKKCTVLGGTGMCDSGGTEPTGLGGTGVCESGGTEPTGLKGTGVCDSGGTEPTGLEGAGVCNSVGVLDSCTMVEGLPFPVEYYVRTTRRMASSQSHRDLQAVILSQLSRGPHRRSRSLTPSAHKHSTSRTHTVRHAHSGTPEDHSHDTQSPSQLTSDSQTNRAPVKGPLVNRRLTSELGTNQSVCVRPVRGRRGRGKRPSRSLSMELPCPAPGLDHSLTSLTPASQRCPGAGRLEGMPLSGGVEEQLYPIFRRSCVMPIYRPEPTNGPAVHPGSLSGGGSTLDVQDFHLPDDEFGQLKLQKLRGSSSSVVTATLPFPQPERFSPYNMRRRRGNGSLGSTALTSRTDLLPLPLCPSVTERLVESLELSVDHKDKLKGLQSTASDQSTDYHLHPIDTQRSELPVVKPIDVHPVDHDTGLLPNECTTKCTSLQTETDSERPTKGFAMLCSSPCRNLQPLADPPSPLSSLPLPLG
ncbi:hypothetical protein UPYG_G00053010, partial [Umbra pygmaea]